ncbi:MAG: 5-oxoprolinase subunit PxpB [Candidatus Bathyarchaeota archaeon]|nr:MAG: 5-oxoprolinase subunit PxpB [Candidatus Bathyarchaeota archaeon]
MKHLPVGDKALLVEFGNSINLQINQKVRNLDSLISQSALEGILECVPTYCSLLIYYDPLRISFDQLVSQLRDLEERMSEVNFPGPETVIEVPVIYGGEYGPDLDSLARYHNLLEEEVIQLHSGKKYTVFMIGFIAGFPYLGEVDDRIVTPRLATPRLRVPAGSVGIADRQTGIYPFESPGGWRIIGRTRIRLFDSGKSPPSLMKPGDIVTFRPIGEEEFELDSK